MEKKDPEKYKCHNDCLTLFECNKVYYCTKHMDKFNSLNEIMCICYVPDKIKILTEKTAIMNEIDISSAEEKKAMQINKEEQAKIESMLKNHAKECPEFSKFMEYLYRVFQNNTGMVSGKQVMRSYVHYCPCCGNEIEE